MRGRIGGESDRFAMIPLSVMQCEAATTIGHAAFRILAILATQYTGHNNGTLALTERFARSFGFRGRDTIYRSLRELESRNLIVCTRRGIRVKNVFTLYALGWRDIDFREGKRLETPEPCKKSLWLNWRCPATRISSGKTGIHTDDRDSLIPTVGNDGRDFIPIRAGSNSGCVPAIGNTLRISPRGVGLRASSNGNERAETNAGAESSIGRSRFEMTTRKSQGTTSSASDTNTLRVPESGNKDAQLARLAVAPSLQAALTIKQFNAPTGDVELTALVDELRSLARDASGGNLERAEAMLTIQAHTLDAIFNSLARRSARNAGEYIQACETYMRLALKAQSQCRATLETLAAIKNPQPVTFVRQANVAHGPQQVNNAADPAGEASRARESENRPNKLLEQQHGERLDTGAPLAAGISNPSLEAVAVVHRPEDSGR
jgi:hypothetical protein